MWHLFLTVFISFLVIRMIDKINIGNYNPVLTHVSQYSALRNRIDLVPTTTKTITLCEAVGHKI